MGITHKAKTKNRDKRQKQENQMTTKDARARQ